MQAATRTQLCEKHAGAAPEAAKSSKAQQPKAALPWDCGTVAGVDGWCMAACGHFHTQQSCVCQPDFQQATSGPQTPVMLVVPQRHLLYQVRQMTWRTIIVNISLVLSASNYHKVHAYNRGSLAVETCTDMPATCHHSEAQALATKTCV